MSDYGAKVLRGDVTGKDVKTAGIEDLLLHSDYPMFKYHNEYPTSVTFNPGDHTKTVSITHGLGYVPAFIAYGVRDDDGANFIIPSIPYGIGVSSWAECYADKDKIYFTFNIYDEITGAGWNEFIYDLGAVFPEYFDGDMAIIAGNIIGDSYSSGYRFDNIDLDKDQSISSASIEFLDIYSGTTNSDTKLKLYGCDEDDVSNIDLNNSKTTAYYDTNVPHQSSLFNYGFNVKSTIEEIIARNGWSNGNNLGFMMFDNGSATNARTVFNLDSTINLKILLPGTLTINFRAIVFKDKIA